MIVFLNFAPFRFMGGAEKWAYETACSIKSKDQIYLISVSNKIADVYANLVLKRNFENRVKNLETSSIKEKTISLKSFIPFSAEWKSLHSKFNDAQKIYIKFELLELMLLTYFAGPSVLKKTIAGIHTPYIYQEPITFFDKLHNLVYGSYLSKFILSKFNKVHVITLRDYNLFSKGFKLNNTVYVPNSLAINPITLNNNQRTKKLRVIFVGEFIPRKGIDILVKVIQKSPENIHFDLVGDGPQKNLLAKVMKKDNCTYHNYLDKEKLFKLYAESDVLFLPSRAEGFPLVFVEAIAHGLKILTSNNVAVGLPKNIEYTSLNNTPVEYLSLLKKIIEKEDDKELIKKFYKKEFSFKENKQKVQKEVFAI